MYVQMDELSFWQRNRARIVAGALLLATYGGPIIRWTERIVGWGGSLDFLLSRSKEPGWVGTVLDAFFFPPPPFQLFAIVLAVVLVVRAERRRNDALYGAVDGALRTPTEPVASPALANEDDLAESKPPEGLTEAVTQAYKTIGVALGAEQQIQYDLAVASVEALLVDLSRRNGFPIPKLHEHGTEAGTLRALCYLNALLPALQLNDDVEGRKRAEQIVPQLDSKSATELRDQLGIPHVFEKQVPSPSPLINMRTITAGSNLDPAKPHYEYPKAVLQIEDLKITRSAASEGRLTSVEGRVFVKNHCYMALKECRVAAVSLGQHGVEQTLHGSLFAGRHSESRQEIGQFSLRRDETQGFPLVTRDLKDVVSKPPFLLRLTEQKIPLADNTTYILTLDLHSEAKDVTRVRIQIDTRTGPDFSLTLLDQVVSPR